LETSKLQSPIALVTGGSAGLGAEIVSALVSNGFDVVMIGRSEERLRQSQARLQPLTQSLGRQVKWYVVDVSDKTAVDQVFVEIQADCGRLDVLVNCVGMSDRGRVEDLTKTRVTELIDANVLSAMFCSQAALPMLRASQGVVVNIGSLAAKVGARYLGGYSLAKHALAGLTQQMRLEWRAYGVHVALINPGPIRRDDSGHRYATVGEGIPDSARLPAGGAKLRGLPPQKVAQAVIRAIQKRTPDTVLPGYLRILVAIGHAMPKLGDWLLMKFTSRKS
jgi:short-subunit dehydrogenase